MRTLLAIAIATTTSIVACGKTVSLDNRSCPCASGWTCCENVCVEGASCDANAGGGTGSGSAPPPSTAPVAPAPSGQNYSYFGPEFVAKAKQQCDWTIAGATDDPFSSPADATWKLSHAWLACDGDSWLAQRHAVGYQFWEDGTWELLELTPDGAVQTRAGTNTHGTWTFLGPDDEPLDRNDTRPQRVSTIDLKEANSSGGVGYQTLAFQRDPTRMQLVPVFWYVALNP